jgi:uncharacterized membrane protein YozB (DUF420 family)
MKKKNWFLIVIMLVAVLLIATVIWIYAKRIEQIESKMKISTISVRAKFLLYIGRHQAENHLFLFGSASRQSGNTHILFS